MILRRVDIFFYGLFMDTDILRAKGIEPVNPCRAEVLGMALRIGQRATLVPDASKSTHGILMQLTQDEIHRLYSEESVEAYRPEAVMARLTDGRSIPALCFNLPTPPSVHGENRDYAEKLRDLGRRLDLPVIYLDGLI